LSALSDLVTGERAVDAAAAAFIDRAGSCTFADLDRRAGQVARALAAAGLSEGDRVAFLARNRTEFFEVIFGAATLGAVTVPLNWRLQPVELEGILRDAVVTVLVYEAELDPLSAELRRRLPGQILFVGIDSVVPGAVSYREWRDAQPSGRLARRDAGSDRDVLLLYTSGTTGSPKGALVTEANLRAMVASFSGFYELTSSSTQLFALPLFHIGGLLIGLLGLAAGAKTVLLRDARPAEMIEQAHHHRATHMPVVPVLLDAVLSALADPAGAVADLPCLEMVLYGASSMPTDVLHRAMAAVDVRFLHCYGMTETTATATFLTPDDHGLDERRARLLTSVGRPGPLTELRIVDPATGGELPAGRHGEVCVRGEHVVRRYWNRPKETAAAFLPGGWFRTGDGGYLDENGYLYLTDRIKDMIVSGGENVYPAEVEKVLRTLAGIADVAVVGVAHDRWGEVPLAVVVRDPAIPLCESDVLEHSRRRLAGYKCPVEVVWVDELPRTAAGKVMKHVLREHVAAVRR
jgi:long-chain acyl-CoA synthetase